MQAPDIGLDQQALLEFCRQWKIKELSVFGSVARGDARPSSDIDLLVTFDDDAEWDLSDHVEIQDELAKLVGRRVDLLSRYALESDPNWIFRRSVLTSLEPVYAR
jgi:predicted nucleotidyltransferase